VQALQAGIAVAPTSPTPEAPILPLDLSSCIFGLFLTPFGPNRHKLK
jgi:hypothetical protein